jgi:hypothetical protein
MQQIAQLKQGEAAVFICGYPSTAPPALPGNGSRSDNCYAGYWLCNSTVHPSLIDFVISALSPRCGEIMGYRRFTMKSPIGFDCSSNSTFILACFV